MFIVSNQPGIFVVWDPVKAGPRTGLLSRSDVLRFLTPGGRPDRRFEKALEDAHQFGIGSYGATPAPVCGYLRFRSGRIRTTDVFDCARALASAEPDSVTQLLC